MTLILFSKSIWVLFYKIYNIEIGESPQLNKNKRRNKVISIRGIQSSTENPSRFSQDTETGYNTQKKKKILYWKRKLIISIKKILLLSFVIFDFLRLAFSNGIYWVNAIRFYLFILWEVYPWIFVICCILLCFYAFFFFFR